MRLLGISAFYHDSAAALIEDGRIVAAAQEERFTRRSTMRAFQPRHTLLSGGGQSRPRSGRPRRLLREAADQIRTLVGNLPRQRATWFPIVPNGDSSLDKGKALSKAKLREIAWNLR